MQIVVKGRKSAFMRKVSAPRPRVLRRIERGLSFCNTAARARRAHTGQDIKDNQMYASVQHYRLERSDTISIRKEGTSTTIILVAGFLRHRIRPGIGQFAPKAIIAKQHVGDAFAFS
jgi:hypothetical protein